MKQFMKLFCESSDDYKLALTVNETIAEKTAIFYKAISNGSAWVRSHIAHIKSHKYITSSRSILQSIYYLLPEQMHAPSAELAKIFATDSMARNNKN